MNPYSDREGKDLFRPLCAGLESEPRSALCRMETLLDALENYINPYIIEGGYFTDSLYDLKCNFIKKLKEQGFIVTHTGHGYNIQAMGGE